MNTILLLVIFAKTASTLSINRGGPFKLPNITFDEFSNVKPPSEPGNFDEHFIPFINQYPRGKQYPVTGNSGETVFITPYVEQGLIPEGQNATWVKPLLNDVQSHAGYITVNKKFNSNMFFWFFYSEKTNWKTAPVLLWLQGGPGCTSLYGLFQENGPYHVDETGLHKRNFTWTSEFNVLYIDNPIGTGFSFTQDSGGYATDQHDVGRDLYEALTQFFQLFPEVRENDFYVTGESYAGKYIPVIAHVIHKKNPSARVKINLKGLAIGNGLTDPINMLVYSDYVYQIGLVDLKTAQEIRRYEELARVSIRAGKTRDAYYYWASSLSIISSFGNYYDYRNPQTSLDTLDAHMNKFVQTDYVRRAIHVGSFLFHDFNVDVYHKMVNDMTLSVSHLLPDLLDHYRILFYSGQFDVIVAYPLTVNFLRKLSWKGALEYDEATRKSWYEESHLAGYWKTAYNLTEILVRNAGHMVPTDQPKWAYSMLKRFINGDFK